MTVSNQFSFNPSAGQLTINAFSRIQIKRAEITEAHMQDARMMANLMLADWATQVPNLWTVDLQTTTLVYGQDSYTVDPSTVDILDAYISTANGDGTFTDIYLYPMSRTEYASLPEKEQQARPTTYWFDRLINPVIYMWPVPDNTQTYILKYYRVRQIMDSNYTSGQNVEIPYRFLEAFASGLAAKLAEIYRPERLPILTQIADKYWERAREQDRELTPISIIPGLSGYYGGF